MDTLQNSAALWLADLETAGGPVYLAIVDRLERAVRAGHLAPGTPLPTHRDLARSLGVNVGTITRAYAEAKARGLVGAGRRRGSFVLPQTTTGLSTEPPRARAPSEARASEAHALIDLTTTRPTGEAYAHTLADTLGQLAATPAALLDLQNYYPSAGLERHRAAGAMWLARGGLSHRPGQTLVCNGAQHALVSALLAVGRPGDLVLTEALTYGGVKVAASLLGLRLHGLPMDRDGLLPHALASICEAERPRALICVPNLHNPTNAILPEQRRREIAEIAIKHDLIIIEDDVYGALLDSPLPPIASFAPDHTFLVTSLSKSVAPGMRVGFLAAPDRLVDRAVASMRGTTWMASPIMAEIAARWIEDGTAGRLVAEQRHELARRQALAAATLTLFDAVGHACSPQLWLLLPPTWRAEEFNRQTHMRGVAVMPSEIFAVGHVNAPQAVRLNIGAARDIDQLRDALQRIVSLLASPPEPACLVA